MKFTLDIHTTSFPTRTAFRISRTTVTAVDVVQVTLASDSVVGRGECRPYPRYNQTVESVTAELESARAFIETGEIETALKQLQNKSAARNALEAAWVDYQCKRNGVTAANLLDVAAPSPRQTAFTLSWGSVDAMTSPVAARDLILRAKDKGFTVMAGCMVGSSLAMAPMMTLESLCDIIDLDGALLLAEDVDDGLKYEGSTVFPPSSQLWG